jgi:hypothetical protein
MSRSFLDAAAPDLLVPVEQPCGGPDGGDVGVDDLLAALPLLDHQVRPLEHGDVLLHGGEAHGVGTGQGAHRRLAAQHPGDDVPPGRVGQGGEHAVHLVLVQLTYNHVVVRYARDAGRTRGGGHWAA